MTVKKDLLFEIGVEELPASYIEPALDSLVKYLERSLQNEKLDFSGIIRYSTPRRVALRIKGIPEKQDDETTEKVGPASKIAFNADGSLTKAGQGFLKSSGATREALEIKKTPKGEYISAKVHIKGDLTLKILRQLLPEAIKKIKFPKTMYWKSKNVTFARPIRSLLAIYGDEVIDFEFDGVKTDRVTFGKILYKKAEAARVDDIDNYPSILEKRLVICDREKRKRSIREQIEKLAEELDSKIDPEDKLLEEVTDIVEYPTAVSAKFDEKYLKLPARIIHSTLAKNQKYFTLYSSGENDLLNNFIFIADNHPEYASDTRLGNEKVVKARLDDAVFYLEEDLQKSIEYFNERLTQTVFQASLGSIRDKVERIVRISAFLAKSLDVDGKTRDQVQRAASICKFDLATSMIAEKEFAGLQGYVGKNYALRFGEERSVAEAIEEHYQPLSFTDSLPQSLIGTILSIADKIDTLCGIFGIGNIPTGSQDPYALRRAGNGVIRIIYEKELAFKLSELLDYAYSLVNHLLKEKDNNKEELKNYLIQRIRWVLEQNRIDYDIIDAVMVSGFSDPDKLKKKVEALQLLRERDDFEKLIISFKRVSNIIAQEEHFADLDEKLFREAAEKKLFQALLDLERESQPLLANNDYRKLLERFISLKDKIDHFFDSVMVNVEDKELRKNRYALLERIKRLFLHIGDLSLIVIEGENK